MSGYCYYCGNSGVRFTCKVCKDFELCYPCFDDGIETELHNSSHPMEALSSDRNNPYYFDDEDIEEDMMDNDDYNIDGEECEDEEDEDSEEDDGESGIELPDLDEIDATLSKLFQNLSSITYKCPYCSQAGLTEAVLIEHCLATHQGDRKPVVCPICASRPGGDPNYVSKGFIGHLGLRHSKPNKNLDDFSRGTDLLASIFGITPGALSHILKKENVDTSQIFKERKIVGSSSMGGGSVAKPALTFSLPKSVAGTLSNHSQQQQQQQSAVDILESSLSSSINSIGSGNISNSQKVSLSDTISNSGNPSSLLLSTNSNDNTSIKNSSDDSIVKIKKIELSNLPSKEVEANTKENILKSIFVQDLLYSAVFSPSKEMS